MTVKIIKKSRWESKYGQLSASELVQKLQPLRDYVGRVARGVGITKGREVAIVQMLYNKLVEEGIIEGKKIRVDGVWGIRQTGKAIYSIRKLVGTDYPPKERKKLKNKLIEYTLDGHSVTLLAQKFRIREASIKKVVEEKTKKAEEIKQKIMQVSKNIDALMGRMDIVRDLYSATGGKDNSQLISGVTFTKYMKETAGIRIILGDIKDEIKQGNYAQAKSKIVELNVEISHMHAIIDALEVVMDLQRTERDAKKAYGNANRPDLQILHLKKVFMDKRIKAETMLEKLANGLRAERKKPLKERNNRLIDEFEESIRKIKLYRYGSG